MINIISTFYLSKHNSHLDSVRTNELETCLLNNLSNELIEKIHLFIDDQEALDRLNKISNNSNKIVVIEIGKRPIYNDFFKYIIDNIKDKICMITNADIYLYEYNLPILEKLINDKIMYTLSRYEHDMSKFQIDNYGGSHDCYIFNSKFINDKIMNEHTIFVQNISGIETHIIKTFCDSGFTVFNPCFQIKIVHLHKSQLRGNYDWIGLHIYGDHNDFKKSCWCVPPITL